MNASVKIKADNTKELPKLVILGAGESGIGAALLAQQQGYDVFVSDGGAIKPVYKDVLQKKEVNRWQKK